MKTLTLLLAAVLLSACATDSSPTETPSQSQSPTIRDCADYSTLPANQGDLPDVLVECLQGDEKVNLSSLKGPMVIPVWASWCMPCREEMPVMQLFDELYGDYVSVLGIALMDETSQAIAGSVNWGVDLPSLEDPDGLLRGDLGFTAPPTTLFIDESGEIVHREFGAISGMQELKELVQQHLGVRL
jgi:cytochrome c biogenesis protein CcmG, thiol:disulfide interchange protein DsbE